MQTINANTAAELIFKLIKEKSWLNKPEIMTPDDFHAEAEAITFLQKLARDGADSFEGISESAQRVVATLLNDFMAKLMHPESPLQRKSWIVDDSKPEAEQALQIIAAEIGSNHRQPQWPH